MQIEGTSLRPPHTLRAGNLGGRLRLGPRLKKKEGLETKRELGRSSGVFPDRAAPLFPAGGAGGGGGGRLFKAGSRASRAGARAASCCPHNHRARAQGAARGWGTFPGRKWPRECRREGEAEARLPPGERAGYRAGGRGTSRAAQVGRTGPSRSLRVGPHGQDREASARAGGSAGGRAGGALASAVSGPVGEVSVQCISAWDRKLSRSF